MSYTFAKFFRYIKNCLREINVSALFSLLAMSKLIYTKSLYSRIVIISKALSHLRILQSSNTIVRYALNIARSPVLYSGKNKKLVLKNSIILKPYISAREKGFLLISFERELQKVVPYSILDAIQIRYHIIFMPSWSGLFSPPLLALAARSQEMFFVMPVHVWERRMCNQLGYNCRALPFNAASWVKEEFFSGYRGPRDIDCLMVANFAEFKRHWILFRALSRLPREINAVCVGVSLGTRTSDSLRKEASEYGVSDRITIVENPSQEDLRIYFQRAKAFCALSYREGSYIAVAESLMAGTPVIMFKNSYIGTKELINHINGALVNSVSELREKILYFLHSDNHADIRKNAQKRVASKVNCMELNGMLKDWALNSGGDWTREIEPVYSMRLEWYYESPESWQNLSGDYAYLKDRGIEVNGF